MTSLVTIEPSVAKWLDMHDLVSKITPNSIKPWIVTLILVDLCNQLTSYIVYAANAYCLCNKNMQFVHPACGNICRLCTVYLVISSARLFFCENLSLAWWLFFGPIAIWLQKGCLNFQITMSSFVSIEIVKHYQEKNEVVIFQKRWIFKWNYVCLCIFCWAVIYSLFFLVLAGWVNKAS